MLCHNTEGAIDLTGTDPVATDDQRTLVVGIDVLEVDAEHTHGLSE